MNFEGFVGPSVPSRSRTINCERTVNLVIEASAGTPKRTPSFVPRPALVPWTNIEPGPVRGLFFQDNRFFGVSGNYVYQIDQSRNVTILGTVQENSRPATFATNGTGGQQQAFTSGGKLYVWNFVTEVFAEVTDPNVPNPIDFIAYADTYGVGLESSSNTFKISSPEDFTLWNGLDAAQTSLSSDRKLALAVSHRELWFPGSKNTEVWYDSGNANFPYQPVDGVFIEHGILAPYSIANLDNTLYWLGQDALGQGIVWRANGYTPERISNHAVETVIASWSNLGSTLGFCVSLQGHAWYLLYNTSAETTWAFDVVTQQWTEWAHWDEVLMRWKPWIGRCQAAGWGQQFIGDRQSGCIYTLDWDAYTDTIKLVGGL